MLKKVSRDPIHSEIFLYPLEIIVVDTLPVQRLRFLSQLAGATIVYPGATHTRFAHSLGTMHIAGMYAKNLFNDPGKERIIRLAGLLHDVGHGPFSHQFDDVVYKRLGIREGHDEYRKRILLEILPKEMMKVFERMTRSDLKKAVIEDLRVVLKEEIKNLEEGFEKVMRMVLKVFEGEESGSVEFNIVQGPLGADRLDFLLRDSYHSGTRHFGTGAMDRIIRNSMIKKVNGKDILCYHIKVMDDIYAMLFGRFMMYRNVYFHKTARAADLMIQEILRYAYKPLRLEERVKNLRDFMELTDETILVEVEELFKALVDKYCDELKEDRDKVMRDILEGEMVLEPIDYDLVEAYKLVKKYRERDLWKLVVEIPFSLEGIDPSVVSHSIAMDVLQKIRLKLENILDEGRVEKEDVSRVQWILENFEDIFKVDTPYKLTLVHPAEFLQSNVYIYDNWRDEVLSFEDYIKKYPAYKLMSSNLIQLVRVYVTEDIRELLRKYDVVPKDGVRIITRW